MWAKGVPRRTRQDLLREHGGLPILVQMLVQPFQSTDLNLQDMFEAAGAATISYNNTQSPSPVLGPSSSNKKNMVPDDRDKLRMIFGVNQLVYKLLTVLTQEHSANQKVCTQFLPVFISQLGYGLNSAGFLAQMTQGNQELLESVTPETIDVCCELILSQVH